VWWQTILNVRDDVGQADTRWMLDNITHQVGDGTMIDLCRLFIPRSRLRLKY